MKIRFFTLSALAFAAVSANASVSLTSASSTYTQNFDTLSNSCPRGCAFTNDSSIVGWSLMRADGTVGEGYFADDGSSTFANTGGFHSLGAANSTERSLGMFPTANENFGTPSPAVGTPAGWIALAATNNTGGALNAFTLGYSGEQWRQGGGNVPTTLTVQYGFGSSFAAVTNWTNTGPGFTFSTPNQSTTPSVIDGNAAGHVTGLGGTVGGLNWNNGDTLWIRWQGLASGTGDSMGVDDVWLSVSAVPEPASLALMLGGLGALGLIARRRALR